jgi:hypothetical protein
MSNERLSLDAAYIDVVLAKIYDRMAKEYHDNKQVVEACQSVYHYGAMKAWGEAIQMVRNVTYFLEREKPKI